jgi:hypothetical protein
MLFSGLGADRDRGVNPGDTGDPDTPAGPGSPAQAGEGRSKVPALLTGPVSGFPVPRRTEPVPVTAGPGTVGPGTAELDGV